MKCQIYGIALKLLHFLFRSNKMSCFPNVNVDQHCDNVTADLLDISLISEETVEKITETRITQHNQRYYKVRWKDSWLLEDQLKEHCCELIKAFWRCVPNDQQGEQNYNLPCFGKTFSSGTAVSASDMFNELVFSDENHDVQQQQQQQMLQHLVVMPMKDKTALDCSSQMSLSHLTLPGEIAKNITIKDPASFCLPVVSNVALHNDITNETETDELDFELEVEQESEDEPDGEGITFYSNYTDASKSCTKCSTEFQTKCKHCNTCPACRPNCKSHFYNCNGEKVCAVCEHCFSGDRCTVCCPYCGQVYPTTLHWKRHVRITHLATHNKSDTKKKKSTTVQKSKEEYDNNINSSNVATPTAQPVIKNWKCDICTKTFVKQHKLRRHEKIHSDVREFQCHVCHKEFVQKIHLQKHLLQHGIGEKRFKCHDCEKWFNHKISLKTHVLKCKVRGGV